MKEQLQKYYLWLCMLMCFFIPFVPKAQAVTSIAMVCSFVIAVFVFDREKLKTPFSNNALISLALFFLITIFLSVFTNGVVNDLSELRKIGQALLVLYIFSLSDSPNKLKTSFIAGVFLSASVSLINIALYVVQTGSYEFYAGEVVEQLMFTQRSYLGFFCVISTIFCLENIFKSNTTKEKKTSLFIVFFMIITIFLISSRTAVLLLIIVLTTTVFKTLNRKLRIISLVGVLALLLSALLINKNLTQRFFYSTDDYRSSFIEKIKVHEPRYLIWTESLDIFHKNKNKLFGIGFGKTQEKLRERYKKIEIPKKRGWFLERDFNSHNQYLDLLLSTGVVGLVFFLAFLFAIIFSYKHSVYSLNTLICITVFMLFENTFHRTFGVFIMALIFYLSIQPFLTKKLNR